MAAPTRKFSTAARARGASLTPLRSAGFAVGMVKSSTRMRG